MSGDNFFVNENFSPIQDECKDCCESTDTDELTHKLAIIEDLDEALLLSIKMAVKSSNADGGGIYITDPLDRSLRLAAVLGISRRAFADAEVLKPLSRAWRFVAHERPQSCSLGVESAIPSKIRKAFVGEGVRFLAMTPLRFQGTFMGALFISSRTMKKISSPARNALEAVAARSSATLFRLRQQEVMKRQEDDLASVARLASSFSKSLSLRQIADRVSDEIKRFKFFDHDCGIRIFLTDAQTGDLRLLSHHGPCEDHPCHSVPLPVGACLCGAAVKTGRVVSSKKGIDEGTRREWRQRFPHSDICVPLKTRDRAFGVINIYLPRGRSLSANSDAYRSLILLCNLISISIDNRQIFEEVEAHRERSLSLALGTIEAKESERKRLAQELHDQVGSSLTALSINLNALRIQTYAVIDELAASKLNNAIAIVKKTAEFVRNEVTNLRPPSLDTSRFVAALQHYVDSFKSWADISVEILCKRDISTLPTFKGITLFRIVQEALLNIAKHSKAKQAKVEIDGNSEKLSITITDNGVGFDVGAYINNPKSNHFGLMIMSERAKAINGLYRLSSSPGEGTTVLVEVPR